MKNKFSLGLILTLFPILAVAQDGGSLSFAPPPGDLSVQFLSNIFGIVDGVLHGTGSQIMGAIFSVFNSAVLALGGIVIMYTLIVSTLNTAHEGQMLGQKWSSLWIPIRSTIGLALLIPKASGYCLMQIFVMWIVVQGVGAADKVWDAALGYLNRGGVIVQGQMNPAVAITAGTTSPSGYGIMQGAQSILASQVCMIGLQQILETKRQSYLDNKDKNNGPCAGTPSDQMSILCNNAVPDFISTVNAVTTQNKPGSASVSSWTVPMPNFDVNSPYKPLNGICGTLTWNSFAQTLTDKHVQQNVGLSDVEMQTVQMSRAIALQQMYMDLAQIAQIMVNNSPSINTQIKSDKPFSMVANSQFGVPLQLSGSKCTSVTDPNCFSWGPEGSGSDLFNGTEFLGAINDYNGIMLPSLNLINEAQNSTNAQNSRAFIAQASSSGWIMAGSYFFNLVNLNQVAQGGGNLVDSNTGIEGSQYTGGSQSLVCPNSTFPILCTWLPQSDDSVYYLQVINALISGAGVDDWKNNPTAQPTPISPPNFGPSLSSTLKIQSGPNAATVYGFTTNSSAVKLPNQAGQAPLQFANLINITADTQTYQLPEMSFDCGYVKTFVFSFCLGQVIGDVLYNAILRTLYNFFLNLFGSFIQSVINAFLLVPIQGMSYIFQQGLAIVSKPGVNPIVALAQMGTYYINFAANMWLMLIEMSIVSVLIPVFGLFIFALIGLAMPIILAWMGVMVMIGFSTAYYVPVFPYIIFTFGAIAWLMAVVEAMVAAPIVALGVTHPEGHDAFGKGEQAIMILMNVFLRPAMMIIGYIAAITLSYVGVWVLNAGFDNAIGFVQGSISFGTANNSAGGTAGTGGTQWGAGSLPSVNVPQVGDIQGGYTGWAGVFAFFFSILIYTTLYLTIVQKAFTLIVALPDRVLRWIGGAPESVGQEVERWAGETGGKVDQAGKETQQGQAAMDKQMAGYIGKAKKSLSDVQTQGGSVTAEGE